MPCQGRQLLQNLEVVNGTSLFITQMESCEGIVANEGWKNSSSF